MLRAVSQVVSQAASNPAKAPFVLAQAVVNASCNATVNENALATITLPANTLGANGSVEILATWAMTNSANIKTTRVRFSGPAGTEFQNRIITTQASSQQLTSISNAGAANSQRGMGVGSPGNGETTNTIVVGAVDTTVDTTIVLSGQKALAGETLTLVKYRVTVFPG